MATAAIIYPHQLYTSHSAVRDSHTQFLVEDPLYFRQYAFHKLKLIFHRATMKRYAKEQLPKARYVEAKQLEHTGDILTFVKKAKCNAVRVVDPNDDWLLRRLQAACTSHEITLTVLPDSHFLTPDSEIEDYTANKQKLFFTDFYIRQRKRLKILLTQDGKPLDGKWSFDTENRKKLPATVRPPMPTLPNEIEYVREAREYVRKQFPDAPGEDTSFIYPTNALEALASLREFLAVRLHDFGVYEDAISTRERVLFHSVLTPMLNVGLLSPQEIIEATLAYQGKVPMNSLEGFVRQIIGWREFMRLVYRNRSRQQRASNYWGHTRPMPAALYTGTTGIAPVDHVIRTLLNTAYCHHIERLMILGNFMLLCDLHPNAVYRWFMELFIDAYDWVMVPNVYGMSQFADGGTMTTKPYISGSSYVLKMSDHKKGDWCPIWDALYWRFIDRHEKFFRSNPRMAVMVSMKDKLGSKMNEHHRVADQFLAGLK